MKNSLAPVIAIAGLGASAASLADYTAAEPQFCAASGCAIVHASAWSHPLGVPLPVIGLAFFAGALLARGRARTAIAAIGGAGALGLIALQAIVIGAWCKLCLVSDLSALAYAGVVIFGRPAPARGWWAIAGAAAVAIPLAMPRPDLRPVVASGMPEVVAREQQPGVVTVVDFVDFECPFCRMLHARLVQALAGATAPVRVVRKMVPLSMHPHALVAALAWCAADRQGKGDAMADALIAAPPDHLTADGCAQLAASLGLDLDRFRRDAEDPEVRARVDGDLADARAAGVHALPTVYIGEQVFAGAGASVDDLAAALARAAG